MRDFARSRRRFANPFSGAIGLLGFFAVAAWLLWRFGPTLARVSSWCSLTVAAMCAAHVNHVSLHAGLIFGDG